jgi:uncharacterized protein
MEWINEPPKWSAEGETITVTAGGQTDFWRKTHANFIADSGHFYQQAVTGDFEMTVKVSGKYATLYDQAGMMIRLDDSNWIKCGIELVEDVQQASVVVTRDYSDWSVIPLPEKPPVIWLRLVRLGNTVEVYFSLDGESYTLMRQAYMIPAPKLQAGLMCAAPKGDGFNVTFEGFTITPR